MLTYLVYYVIPQLTAANKQKETTPFTDASAIMHTTASKATQSETKSPVRIHVKGWFHGHYFRAVPR